MKKILIGLLALGSISAFAQSPIEELSVLCSFHEDYAKQYNPSRLDRWLGNTSYPGKEKFEECVERGLSSYPDGMLKVFVDVCTVLPKSPDSNKEAINHASIRYSKTCRDSLMKTNVPSREAFLKASSHCEDLSNTISKETSDIIASGSHRDYFKVIIENNCLKSNL